MKKTYQPKESEIKRITHEIDAKDKVLGRLASEVSLFLTGKHKPSYSPHMDSGDFVHIKNVKEIHVTGGKEKKLTYVKHSGYPKGFKEIKYEKIKSEHPERLLTMAVFNMLPDNRLRRSRMTRLKFV